MHPNIGFIQDGQSGPEDSVSENKRLVVLVITLYWPGICVYS